jgi:LysR family nod box-dependent transcriptional activator
MRFNGLDLNLLVVLDALLDEKKIIGAARRLSTSQSAISGMLAKLRVHFGDQLLVPTGRSMTVTPLGLDLQEPVRALLLRIQATVAHRPTFDMATEKRTFRITVSDYAVQLMIVPLMHRLQAVAPFISLELRPQIENVHQFLRNGETDLSIMPAEFIDPGQPHAPLFEETFSCVVWEGNTAVGATLDLDTFLQCGHAVVRLGQPSVPSLAESHLDALGLARRTCITTHDFTSLIPMIVNTQMIATTQTRLAVDTRQRLPVRVLAPPVPLPALRMSMQWHRYQTDDPSHRWLREQLLDVARELGLPGQPATR